MFDTWVPFRTLREQNAPKSLKSTQILEPKLLQTSLIKTQADTEIPHLKKLESVLAAAVTAHHKYHFHIFWMCHLFRSSLLPWRWKCPVESRGQLHYVWDFILPRVRRGNVSQIVETKQSVSLWKPPSALPLSHKATHNYITIITWPSPACFVSAHYSLSRIDLPTQNQSVKEEWQDLRKQIQVLVSL